MSKKISKHPENLKLRVLDAILKDGKTPVSVAHEEKLSIFTIENWLKLEKRRANPDQFDKKVGQPRSHSQEKVKKTLALLSEKMVSEVAKETGVNATTIAKWAKEHGVQLKKVTDFSAKEGDKSFSWISECYPQYEEWRSLARQWVAEQHRGVDLKIKAVPDFIKYLAEHLEPIHGRPLSPQSFLTQTNRFPSFFDTLLVGRSDSAGVNRNNAIHDFMNWILLTQFSVPDDHGQSLVSSEFHNPIATLSRSKKIGPSESVRSPLPYGYIEELRMALAQGPDFKDWTWAHGALGFFKDNAGRPGPDWFEVPEVLIDKNDPDCVWRERLKSKKSGHIHKVFEMWSPVRWVAILIKLILPLRTVQTRLLDSGEADTFIYSSEKKWVKNESKLAEGNAKKPHAFGVFKRTTQPGDERSDTTILYINTNKTADINQSGSNKGFAMPWSSTGPTHGNPFHWLCKLRDWQTKYNPLIKRVAWSALDTARIEVKSDIQLASYEDACFLFRTPELSGCEHLPITNGSLETPWYKILEEFQRRLAKRGEKHGDGSAIELVEHASSKESGATVRTYFPLHSLRVSLITALALEGKVPFPILQKVVGHSRLIMTLYYTKPGASYIGQELDDALKRLEAKKGETIVSFLKNTQYDVLIENAIANSSTSVAAAIPQHDASRNPAGWMPMHHGLCLVGGNTTASDANGSVGGCHNGGPNLGSDLFPKHAAVSGGARNCVRCRWFVTDAAYIPALVSHLNNIFYHYDEARKGCLKLDAELGELRARRFQLEENGAEFAELRTLRDLERRYESAMKKFSDLAEDAAACCALIQRCEESLKSTSHGQKHALIAQGGRMEIKTGIEEVDSELLQLSGVCQSTEVYPDLDPGKAVFRRSQLLDAALQRDGVQPVFLSLDEADQLRLGNLFMARLAREFDKNNPTLGERTAISLIDAKQSLSRHLGIGLEEITQQTLPMSPSSGHNKGN